MTRITDSPRPWWPSTIKLLGRNPGLTRTRIKTPMLWTLGQWRRRVGHHSLEHSLRKCAQCLWRLEAVSGAEKLVIFLEIALWRIRANSSTNRHRKEPIPRRMFTRTFKAWQLNKGRSWWKCWQQTQVFKGGACTDSSYSFHFYFKCHCSWDWK